MIALRYWALTKLEVLTIKRNLQTLLNGLDKLNQDYHLQNAILMIKFGMDSYTSIDIEDMEVFDWVDVQEWAKTMEGIFKQLETKLLGKQ